MTSQRTDKGDLVVLTDDSAEHNYAKLPSPATTSLEFSANIDLADLLGIATEEPLLGQENGLVPSDNTTVPSDWLMSMYEPDHLSVEAEHLQSSHAALHKCGVSSDPFSDTVMPSHMPLQASGLVSDPFLNPSEPMAGFVNDLEASMACEAGQLDSDLATWLDDMMKETPDGKPTAVTRQPVVSHGSPSSDPGYDSHGSVSSPGSASGESEHFAPAVASVQSHRPAPQIQDTLLCGADKPSKDDGHQTLLPKISFEELERIKLSGPTAFSSSSQVCWQPGEFKLTPDEVEVLEVEKLPVPTGLPLSNPEEKALKYVRRKIKNKIAAQESRRKKKEYVEGLEKRIVVCTENNGKLQRKVKSLEDENKSLLEQLKELQEQVAQSFSVVHTVPSKQEPLLFASPPLQRDPVTSSRPSVRTSLLVLALCFALILPFAPGTGNIHLFSSTRPTVAQPTSMPPGAATPYDYTVTKFRSRVLLHTPDPANSLSSPPLEDSVMPSAATPTAAAAMPTPPPPVHEQLPTREVEKAVFAHPRHVRL